MKKSPLVLLALLAVAPLRAQLKIEIHEGVDAVVTATSTPGYLLKLDLAKGGIGTDFQIPAGSPNLTMDGPGWHGLFNLFSNDNQSGNPKAHTDGGVAKTLIRRGKIASARVLKDSPTEIVFEVKGSCTGSGLIGPAGETTLEYRQTYTFKSDRINCDGEIHWLYGYDTNPSEVAVLNYFSPHSLQWPVRMLRPDGTKVDLVLGSSDGQPVPAGLNHPLTTEIWFRSGQRILLRTLKVPAVWADVPWVKYERPYQTDWNQMVGFTGKRRLTKLRYPLGQDPISYQYEFEIPAEKPANTPPMVQILSPVRGSSPATADEEENSGLNFKEGDFLRLSAAARDKEDGWLPDGAITWEVRSAGAFDKVIGGGTGAEISYRVPAPSPKVFFIKVSARDSKGLQSEDYITFRCKK